MRVTESSSLDLDLQNNLEKKLFFEVNVENNQPKLSYIDAVENTDEYPERPLNGQKCDFDKILALLNEEQIMLEQSLKTIESKVQGGQKTGKNQEPNIAHTYENSDIKELLKIIGQQNQLKTHKTRFSGKLKFEEARGIEQFLSQVESYCEANDISEDAAKVKVALAALDSSDHGIILKETVQGAEKSNWELFKAKLTSVLGKDYEFYDEKFSNFKRGILSPGLALAQMTLFYKKSFPEYRQTLNDDDKRVILRAFIRSLSQPIRGLIRAEEHVLTLDTVAGRVQQLERAYAIDNNPLINTVENEPQNTDFADKLKKLELENQVQANHIKTQQSLLNGLISNINISSANNQSFKSDQTKKRGRFTNRNPDKYKDLEGYCFKYIFGECSFPKCRYTHATESDLPEKVFEYAKKLRAQSK